MVLHKMLMVVHEHRRTVLLLGTVGLVGGAVVGLGRSQVHRAEAQVVAAVMSPQDSDPQTLNAAIAPMLQPDYLATQVDIINSDRVAERAAELLKIDTDPNAMADYRKAGQKVSPAVFFGRQLHQNLKVTPSIGSRLIAIDYSAPDAAAAAEGANAFAKAYLDVSLDLIVSPSRQSDEWYQRNLDDLRHQLEGAQSRLIARQRELGVTAPLTTSAASVSVEPEEARLTTLSQMLAQAQAAQTTAQSHTGSGALPDAMANPVIQGLDADIKRLEAQRAQMAGHLGPNSSEMREIGGQIATLRSERDKQASTVSRSVSAAAGQASANVAGLESQLSAEKSRLIQSRSGRAKLGVLQQDVDGLRRAYDDLVNRRASARVAASRAQTNVAILSLASPSSDKSAITIAIGAILGALAGLIIGLISAGIRELADRRLRAPEEAELLLDVPNLGPLSLQASETRNFWNGRQSALLFRKG